MTLDDPALRRVLAALTRESADWIAVLGPTGHCRVVCGAFERMLGHGEEDLVEHAFVEGVEAAFTARVEQAMCEAESRPGTTVSVEYRRRRKDGASVELRSSFVSHLDDPAIQGIVATTTALGPSTGVADRDAFRDRLSAVVEMRTRPYAVAVVHLRNLPQVTAALGHAAAGGLAEHVARRLHAAVGPEGVIGHVGPQEFAVLLEGEEDEGRARATAERLYGRLRAPFRIHGRELVLNPSLGFVTNRRGYDDAEEVLRDAMSAAHRAGGGRSQMFHTTMGREDRRKLMVAAALPRAFESDQLETRYQPIVDLASGEIVGAEALIRWKHPTLGYVPPDEFIPVAETSDWIIPIDRWMLGRAMQEASGWDDGVAVSINVSGRHLEDPGLPAFVDETLRSSGLPAARLRLELTETALASDVRASADALQRLRLLGVTLAIDDFGTGYSSFAQLADLPFDILKVDRSMVMRLDGQASGRNVVPGIVSMAHQLGLTVVAEGIETEAQRLALRQLGSEYGQGYLFSKPITVDEMIELLASTPRY